MKENNDGRELKILTAMKSKLENEQVTELNDKQREKCNGIPHTLV